MNPVSGLSGPVFSPPPPATLPAVAPSQAFHPAVLPPLGRQPAENWATNWMNDLPVFCPTLSCLVSLTGPPGVFMLPRRQPGRTWPGWRDGMFGPQNKKGREIESDTWQGPLPGQHAGEAGLHPRQALIGSPLPGSWQRPEWARRGTVLGSCLWVMENLSIAHGGPAALAC